MGYFPVRYGSIVVIYERKMFIKDCPQVELDEKYERHNQWCQLFLIYILNAIHCSNCSSMFHVFRICLAGLSMVPAKG